MIPSWTDCLPSVVRIDRLRAALVQVLDLKPHRDGLLHELRDPALDDFKREFRGSLVDRSDRQQAVRGGTARAPP